MGVSLAAGGCGTDVLHICTAGEYVRRVRLTMSRRGGGGVGDGRSCVGVTTHNARMPLQTTNVGVGSLIQSIHW